MLVLDLCDTTPKPVAPNSAAIPQAGPAKKTWEKCVEVVYPILFKYIIYNLHKYADDDWILVLYTYNIQYPSPV